MGSVAPVGGVGGAGRGLRVDAAAAAGGGGGRRINCNVMVIHVHPCSAFVQIASQQINLQAILLAHPPKR